MSSSVVPTLPTPPATNVSARPLESLLDLFGRRWTLRVLWELRAGPCSFRALQERCGGISPTVLNQRLREIRAAGLVTRADGVGYSLTAEGREVLPALTEWERWAHKRAH